MTTYTVSEDVERLDRIARTLFGSERGGTVVVGDRAQRRVRVRAPDPKGRHAGPRRAPRQRPVSRRDDHAARRQGHDLRVEPFEMRDRGRDVVRERERGLEEAREPRGGGSGPR